MNTCQKRILQNIADGINSVAQGCNLRKRTKLMMPKEPLLKENSPIKKQFDVPKSNGSSNSSVTNNLFNVNMIFINEKQFATCQCYKVSYEYFFYIFYVGKQRFCCSKSAASYLRLCRKIESMQCLHKKT